MAEGRGEQQGSGVGFAEYLVEQVLNAGELERLEEAIARRRRDLGISGGGDETDRGGPEALPTSSSGVLEYRTHEDGIMHQETRLLRRKDGSMAEHGPYWYFRYCEGGKQKKLYLGRTNDPEGALEAKRGAQA